LENILQLTFFIVFVEKWCTC